MFITETGHTTEIGTSWIYEKPLYGLLSLVNNNKFSQQERSQNEMGAVFNA